MRIPVKIFDVFIVLLSAACVFFASYFAYAKPNTDARVLIRARGKQWIYQIDSEETVAVSGLLGNTVVRIEGGRAWVESSPCGNQTCVAAGFVTRPGQWAACLPNNVLLIVQGTQSQGGKNDVDALSF